MNLIKTPTFTLIFGNKTLSCSAETMPQATNLATLNKHEELFIKAQRLCATKTLILVRQTHGTEALVITSEKELSETLKTIIEADMIITTLPNVAIGVLTADCLPLLLVDPVSQAIAAVHAGWRGTVADIAGKAVKHLEKIAGSKPRNIQAYLGPCAHVESYPASDELIAALKSCPFKKAVLKDYKEEIHFDIPLLNRFYLEQAGVLPEHINEEKSVCTITSPEYWSYRRDKEMAGRQLSAICRAKGIICPVKFIKNSGSKGICRNPS